MNDNEIRNELIQFFRKLIEQKGDKIQITTTYLDVGRHFESKLRNNPKKNEIHLKIKEIIHEFLNNNLLMYGYGSDFHEDGVRPPWLTLTDFGITCIKEGNLLPYDPQGYLTEIKKQIPALDEVTLTYLQEAIITYNKKCLLSSSITLGVASENLIITLIETFAESLNDNKEKESFNKKLSEKDGIYYKYDCFKVKLKEKKKSIPLEIYNNFETYLDGIFNFIRINRNSSGHPTGEIPNENAIYSNLQIFATYSKHLFDMIEYFKNNKI